MFFIETSYFFIILFYLLGQIENIRLYGMLEISLCISILLLNFYYIKEKRQLFPNKNVMKIFFYMVLIFFVYQFLNINEFYAKETLKESVRNLLVIISLFMFSGYIYYEKCEDKFIIITYLIMSIFICSIYMYNFDNFEGLKQISMVFNNLYRYRNSYGLSHPNSTGLICYLDLLLAFYLYNCLSYKKVLIKILMLCINIVIFIVLISTASRTAITSLILFFIVFYFIKIKNRFNINKYTSIIIKFITLSVCIIIIINIIQGIGLTELLEQSNRNTNFTVNIPILFANHKEIFGMGYFDVFPKYYFGTSYIDNWYLYMFLTSGIIGLILSVLLIIKAYFYILKNNKKSLLEVFTMSYFISQLYYSIFETRFFKSEFLNTFIFWIFIFTTIFYKKYDEKL